MSDTLQNVCLQVATYLRSLSGVRAAPGYAPDKLDPFPFAVVYPGAGVWQFGATPGEKKALASIIVEMHVARKDLPKDLEKAMAFGDTVPNLLMGKLISDNKWNGKIDTFENITYTFGVLGWNGLMTIGYRWTVNNIKLRSNIT